MAENRQVVNSWTYWQNAVGVWIPVTPTTPLPVTYYLPFGATWSFAAEVVAPGAGVALVTQAVGAGEVGYIYGFLISAQEANDFLINWTSGGAGYTKRIIFGAMGTTECVDSVALNDGLMADAGTNMTITVVNAGGVGMIYQANLLYGLV